MGRREVTAFALGPLLLAAIAFLPSWAYLAVILGASLLAAWELLVMTRLLELSVPVAPTLTATAAGLPIVWWLGYERAGSVVAALVILLPLAYLFGGTPVSGSTTGIAGSVFVATYFVVSGGAMGLLRTSFADPIGWKATILLFVTIWAGDSGAYYVGSQFGRHKMAPRVSPKKSWEGLAGGTVLTFVAVAVCRVLFFSELDLAAAATIAAVLAAVAPVGDLVESLFKRDSGVKDSSQLIPGHGGFLDRTDSLFFAAPFLLAILLAFGVGS